MSIEFKTAYYVKLLEAPAYQFKGGLAEFSQIISALRERYCRLFYDANSSPEDGDERFILGFHSFEKKETKELKKGDYILLTPQGPTFVSEETFNRFYSLDKPSLNILNGVQK